MEPPNPTDALNHLFGEHACSDTTFDTQALAHQPNASDATAWRVSGEVETPSGVEQFDLVAKDIAFGSVEPDLYRSGRLSDLGSVVRVPAMIAITADANRRTLWTERAEPIDSFHRPEWARVAAGLGVMTRRLQARGPMETLPEVTMQHLSTSSLIAWRRCEVEVAVSGSNPRLVAPWYDGRLLDRIGAVLRSRLQIIGSLDGEVAICHTDCGPHNFGFVADKVVLYDWEEAANGPPGVDLAAFINSSLVVRAVTVGEAFDFESIAVDAYLEAFGAADRDQVLRNYQAHATLIWAARIHTLRWLLTGKVETIARRYGMSPDEFLSWRRTLTEFFLVRAEALL